MADAFGDAPDPEVHKERQMLRHMERVATLIKTDLLDADVLLDYAPEFILLNWVTLEPLVREHRREAGTELLWENFEFIATKARKWSEAKKALAVGQTET